MSSRPISLVPGGGINATPVDPTLIPGRVTFPTVTFHSIIFNPSGEGTVWIAISCFSKKSSPSKTGTEAFTLSTTTKVCFDRESPKYSSTSTVPVVEMESPSMVAR